MSNAINDANSLYFRRISTSNDDREITVKAVLDILVLSANKHFVSNQND